jgi:hypothetical protein
MSHIIIGFCCVGGMVAANASLAVIDWRYALSAAPFTFYCCKVFILAMVRE